MGKKELVKTFTEVEARKLVSVKHHGPGALGGLTSSSALGANESTDDDDDSGDTDPMTVAALVLSCVAIAAVMANFWVNSNQEGTKKQEALPLTQTKNDDASVQ